MSYITRHLKQKITYWSQGSTPDGYGGTNWGTPTVINGRWEERSDEFLDNSGRETISSAVVYLAADVSLGGYLYEGSSTAPDPTKVSGAKEIRGFRKLPDLGASKFERKAML